MYLILADYRETYSRRVYFTGEYMNTIVFFDGQNIYRGALGKWRTPASDTYIYTWPSYDVKKLATAVASKTDGRTISQIRFYTGVPTSYQNPRWNSFWEKKIKHLKSQGVEIYQGAISQHHTEKGVDVKLAVDLIRLTYEKKYELAIILSQDRDFEPAIKLAKEIAIDQSRELMFESHFIVGDSDRGIPGTTWIPIDKTTYDACSDSNDYR